MDTQVDLATMADDAADHAARSLASRRPSAVSDPDVRRVRALEERVRELEASHAQLLAYAEDLNLTYQESRARLLQMAELSSLAARLVRARNVETCARMSVEGLTVVLRDVAAALYLEGREGHTNLWAGRTDGAGVEILNLSSAGALERN